jgi:LAGLIDADG endonuclease
MGARRGSRAIVTARLAATPAIPYADGHFLAGFLDAEASFLIHRINNSRNWQCGMRVKLRRDDARILVEMQRLTGVGTLTAVPARGTSKPQVGWAVTSRLECLRLCELLEEFPMYGRKRLEVHEWIRAVRAIDQQGSSSTSIGEYAERLQARRRYAEPLTTTAHPGRDQAGFLFYFGGLFTGEGSLQLCATRARATIKLRRDDRPLLAGLAEVIGLGRLYDFAPCGNACPSSGWIVLAQPELPEMCELLADARLRGRKLREFKVWQAGVDEFTRARIEGRPRDRELIELAAAGLRQVRVYVDRSFTPTGDGADAQREAFLHVLRAWAAETRGVLTSTSYEESRCEHPHWPKSDTMTRAFGSWGAALSAADLAHRASPRTKTRQRACSASIPTTAASISRRSRVR